MTEQFERYLGKPVSIFLETAPYASWPYQRSVEDELDERIFHYVFDGHGLELRCDQGDKISVIFLFAEEYGGFDEKLLQTPFSWSRKKVLQHLGNASKSGEKTSDPILGDYGAWDRFTLPGYSLHFEYRIDADSIRKITFIRDDQVR